MWLGDSDSYSNPNLEGSQKFSIKKEKENSEDGMKSFELCSNPHNFSGNYLMGKKMFKDVTIKQFWSNFERIGALHFNRIFFRTIKPMNGHCRLRQPH